MCVTAGLFLFGIAGSEDLVTFLAGGMLLAVGGGLTLLNSFTLGYVLDQSHMALVLSATNCLFDASGVTFLFAYLLYTHLHVTRRSLFGGMAVLSLLLFAALVALWSRVEPELRKKKEEVLNQRKEVEEEEEPLSGEGVELAWTERQGQASPAPDSPAQTLGTKRRSCRTVQEKHATPWLQETRSRAFLFGVVFGSMQFFRVHVMFGTILDILKGLGDEDTGFLYTQIFVASLPLGFLSIPLITHSLKRLGLVHTFHVIVMLGCGYGFFLMVSALVMHPTGAPREA